MEIPIVMNIDKTLTFEEIFDEIKRYSADWKDLAIQAGKERYIPRQLNLLKKELTVHKLLKDAYEKSPTPENRKNYFQCIENRNRNREKSKPKALTNKLSSESEALTLNE